MDQADLQIGKFYTNGKKRESIRQLIQFLECPVDWETKMCIRYLVIKGLKPEVGREYTITRKAFAKWARGISDNRPHTY
jgi:hypothetical protein